MKNISFMTGVFLGLCLIPGEAMAICNAIESRDETETLDVGTFSFQLENDLFSGTDRHYTNGLRLSWVSPSGKTFESLCSAREILESLPFVDTNETVRLGFSLGQDIYTPKDRYATSLLSDDRPYGAWLYGAVALHTITDFKNSDIESLNSVELSLGIVGPMALGEEAQDLIHEIRLIDTFEGWDNQIKNEPGIMLRYENKWRFGDPVNLIGFGEFDAIPRMGLTLGNVSTQAGAGGAVRWGWNLPKNFGPPSLIQGGTPFLSWDRDDDDNYSVYLFATANGSFVGHNIFLDGNTFRESHSVDKRPFIADFSAGFTVLNGPVSLSYTTALRTREFEGQEKNSRYGSVSLSMQNPF